MIENIHKYNIHISFFFFFFFFFNDVDDFEIEHKTIDVDDFEIELLLILGQEVQYPLNGLSI